MSKQDTAVAEVPSTEYPVAVARKKKNVGRKIAAVENASRFADLRAPRLLLHMPVAHMHVIWTIHKVSRPTWW